MMTIKNNTLIGLNTLKKLNLKILNNIHTLSIIPFFNVVPESLNGFQRLIAGILVLSVIFLWCFINVIGYFGFLYMIKNTDLENKYPKYKFITNYLKKLNYVFIIMETIFIIIILLSVIGICSYLLYHSLI